MENMHGPSKDLLLLQSNIYAGCGHFWESVILELPYFHRICWKQ